MSLLTIVAEAAPKGIWYPVILGILVVLAGIALFCGSIYVTGLSRSRWRMATTPPGYSPNRASIFREPHAEHLGAELPLTADSVDGGEMHGLLARLLRDVPLQAIPNLLDRSRLLRGRADRQEQERVEQKAASSGHSRPILADRVADRRAHARPRG